MSRLLIVPLLLIACMFMTACTANQRVQSNYDDSQDHSRYETFGFTGLTEDEDPDLADTLELYFSAAVAQHLQLMGLGIADNPDLLIDVSAVLEDVSRAPVNNAGCPNYENYNSRRLTLTSGSRRPMCIYSEGLVEVEIVDVQTGLATFEGTSRVRLDKDDRDASLLLSVSYDVANMFGESPARDGRPIVYGSRN